MDDAEFRTRYNAVVALLKEGRLEETTRAIAELRNAVEEGSVQRARVEIVDANLQQARIGRSVHGDASTLSSMIEAQLQGAYTILQQHPTDSTAMVLAGQVAIQLAERSGQFREAAQTAYWYREAARSGTAAGDRFTGAADLFGASASFSLVSGKFDDALETLAASSGDFQLPDGERALSPAPGEPPALAEAVERAMVAAFERGTVWLSFDLAKAFLNARLNAGAKAEEVDAVANLLRDLVDSKRDDEYAILTCRVVLRARHASPMMLAALGYSTGLAADRLGKYAEAGEIFREALERVARYSEVEQDPLVLSLRYEIAENARVLGAFDAARTGFGQLAVLYERLGQQDAHVARVFNNYADALAAARSLDEAEKWARQALAIREALLQQPHHDLGRSHATLGNLLYALGKKEEARFHATRAVANFAHDPGRESTRYAGALHLQANTS